MHVWWSVISDNARDKVTITEYSGSENQETETKPKIHTDKTLIGISTWIIMQVISCKRQVVIIWGSCLFKNC